MLIIIFFLFVSFGAFDVTFDSLSTNITLIALIFATPLREYLVSIYGGYSLLIHRKIRIGSEISVQDSREIVGRVIEINLTNSVILLNSTALDNSTNNKKQFAEVPNSIFVLKSFLFEKMDQQQQQQQHLPLANIKLRNIREDNQYDKGFFNNNNNIATGIINMNNN
jgi:hypothetical protein